jgi:hypothetical protein
MYLYGNFSRKAFFVAFEKDCSKGYLQKAYNFFKHYEQILWITAITVIAFYTVICMKYLEDKSGLRNRYQIILTVRNYYLVNNIFRPLPRGKPSEERGAGEVFAGEYA